MLRHVALAGISAVFLVMLLPFFALADDINIGVVPAEIRIDNLSPGETAKFELTIHNNDAISRSFTLAVSVPPEGQEKTGATQFPDGSWISFSPDRTEVVPYGEANVTVMVAIPREQKWTSQDWETWLGVTAESTDMLGVRLYTRLLVSTNSTVAQRFNVRLLVGIGLPALLLGCGGFYYFRRRARFN